MTDRKIHAVRLLLVWTLLEVLAAVQVRTPTGRTLIGLWLDTASRPVEWLANRGAELSHGVIAHLTSRRRLATENRHLRRELELALAGKQLLLGEVASLREALAALPVAQGFDLEPLAGRSVYRNVGGGRLEVLVPGPVPLDTPVIGSGGLIGRVIVSRGRTTWIELITHPAAAVAVQTADGQVQAIAAGTGGDILDINYVPRSALLVEDTPLLTSGADGVYPAGLPVAVVSHVRELDAAFLEVHARPTASVEASRMVLLLTPPGAGSRPERPR